MPDQPEVFAYSSALAGESVELRDKFDPAANTFSGVTHEDLERIARIVAYKVAHNLERGFRMDPALNPLRE